jgi:ribose-phosphate pyrophosphokinase
MVGIFKDDKETPVVFTNFPNGETVVPEIKQYSNSNEKISFYLYYESDCDLMNLMFLRKQVKTASLKIDFFPYGQMDRKIEGKGFTLKMIADFINWLDFELVSICDPHSDVTPALVNNAEIRYPELPVDEKTLICYPDNGAAKKYSEVYKNPYIFGYKKRNLDNGEIIRFELCAEKSEIEGKTFLIKDDICMGGRTFKECAKALKENGAKKVILHITHLMPQAKEFYENHKDFGIDEFYSENTLKLDWYPKKTVQKLSGDFAVREIKR